MASALNSVLMTEADFSSTRIEQVFAKCFGQRYATCLHGGVTEPLYEPARGDRMAILHYRHDYFASALHEVAHWCIAGKERRNLIDFGYWYADDGRSESQQSAFESVEFKPQALEWYFARACGWRFQISVDNLDTETGLLPDTSALCQRVVGQAQLWKENGLPRRGEIFYNALSDEFGTLIRSNEQIFSSGDIL